MSLIPLAFLALMARNIWKRSEKLSKIQQNLADHISALNPANDACLIQEVKQRLVPTSSYFTTYSYIQMPNVYILLLVAIGKIVIAKNILRRAISMDDNQYEYSSRDLNDTTITFESDGNESDEP